MIPVREEKNAPGRTGHVAPDETLDPGTYIAHIEGRESVVERAPGPFRTIEEAVSWAQQRAPTVLVRTQGDSVIRWTGQRPLPSAPDMPHLLL